MGVSVLANKYRGVRCALSWSPEHVKSARNDDNANMLALPADYLSKETALQITLAFLETPFSNAERHIRRLHKIYDYSSHS
ncbi:RpiB/LacA/LacB family sugar-phosphate isomerase [Patescibacteria group bacterium]|nr:RpiB/LacA/LacB family sugar-phosphate isomerase [Patescibacteria group bacterium]